MADRESVIVRIVLSGRFIPLLAEPDHPFVRSDFAKAREGLLTATIRRFPAGGESVGFRQGQTHLERRANLISPKYARGKSTQYLRALK